MKSCFNHIHDALLQFLLVLTKSLQIMRFYGRKSEFRNVLAIMFRCVCVLPSPRSYISQAATEKLQGLCLLLEPDLETAASPTDATRTRQRRKRCERGPKRGKRGGIRARLRANPTRPALPTLMLSNVRSLENKLDLIQLSQSTQHESRDCCVFVFTETWLNNNIPDSAIQLHGLNCYRADRDSSLSGKTCGGGLFVYINKEWCNNSAVISKHCSSLMEFMFVKCRPFYLPREFTAIVIATVYIPPCANAKDALRELYSAISEQQTNNPDGFFIIAGDFNHANLKTVLPKFYQHVNFATRGNNTLDFVYKKSHTKLNPALTSGTRITSLLC